STVPNGVDVELFEPRPSETRPGTILFAGLLSYRPNWDAVHHLVEDIFPRVLERRPDAQLEIVGRGDETLRHLRWPGVTFTGFVDDVLPYLHRAAVVAVPLRSGGGTRFKVVEAFAAGKAVVSTSLGCE